MRIHPRAQQVAIAQTELQIMILQWQEENKLTDTELMQALAGTMQSVLKYQLRAERHPDSPDKGADEE